MNIEYSGHELVHQTFQHSMGGELVVYCPKSHIRFSKRCKEDSLTLIKDKKQTR